MRVKLRYKNMNAIDIPDENLIGIYSAGTIKPELSEEEIIRRALANPIGTPPLSHMVEGNQKVLIISDDNTRMTPTYKILPHIFKELKKVDLPDSNVKILMALGTHRKMTQGELISKLGSDVVKRYKVINHDYQDKKRLKSVGKTTLGIEVSVNSLVCEADFVIGIGAIFPHMNVGFSGGGKIITPGVCGEETSGRIHWMMTPYKEEELFGVRDNPIRDAMEEVAEKAGLKFIVNVIQNNKGQLYGVVAGNSKKAHIRGTEIAKKVYGVRIPQKADIVICEAYPGDMNLWQTSKSIGVAGLVMKKDGVVIIISPCPDGISSSFPELISYGYPPAKEVLEMCRRGEIGELLAVHMFQVSRVITDRGKGILVTDGLTPKQVRQMGFIYARSPDEALQKAFDIKGKNASIVVLKHAAEMLPIIG